MKCKRDVPIPDMSDEESPHHSSAVCVYGVFSLYIGPITFEPQFLATSLIFILILK